MSTSRLARDPARITGPCGDTPIQTLGKFQPHPWPTVLPVMQISRVLGAGRRRTGADLDVDSRIRQDGKALARDLGIRIVQ
jgi:hypothetical protein